MDRSRLVCLDRGSGGSESRHTAASDAGRGSPDTPLAARGPLRLAPPRWPRPQSDEVAIRIRPSVDPLSASAFPLDVSSWDRMAA